MRALPCWALVLALSPATLAPTAVGQAGFPKDPTSSVLGPAKLVKTQAAPGAGFGPRTTASDRCDQAPAAGDGDLVQYDLANATNDFAGTCGGTETAPDAWFRVTVAAAARVTATTCGLTAADTVLLATDGCGGAVLACDDDNCGVQSRISFVLAAGGTAWIRIAGYSGARHAGQVAVTLGAPGGGPPPEDRCDAAPEVAPGVYAYDLSAATHDVPGPCDATAEAADAWYRYTTGASDQLVTASTCGRTSGDSVLSWTQGWCGGMTLACADDSCGLQSRVSAIVPARTSVLLRIADSRGGTHAGQVEISAQDVTRPPNDTCEDASVIAMGVPTPFDTTSADDDGWAPCGPGGEPGGHSVWFRFTPAQDGDVQVSTCDGTGFDTILTVYEGCGLAVACNDDACGLRSSVVARVRAGVDYRIRVAGVLAAAGPGSLLLSPVAPCAVTRPPSSILENEGCIADTGADHNGGCTSPGGEVQPVPFGSVLYATASTFTASGQPARDTDWFEFEFPAGEPFLTATARAAFPNLRLFILDNRCPPSVLDSAVSGPACQDVSVFALPDPGTYRVMAAFDGFSGLACGGLYDNHYTLTIGTPPPSCTADFNADGFVDFFDYADYVGCFETGVCPPGTTADVNGDAFVDFFDYADFVDAFEAGC